MTRFTLGIAAALALAATLPAASAHAQNGGLTRSFVSSAGADTNACTITAPCASFAQAYTKVGANGIIAALDPGKYGPLAIVGPVTVNGNGWAAITGAATNTAITITAGSGNVTLTGLEIDGAGAAYNGIVFNSGSSLTVTDCIVQNFLFVGSALTGNGLVIGPTTGPVTFAITNSTFSNNGFAGLSYRPASGTATATGVIDHVVATNNQYGIRIDTSNAGGATAVTIANSVDSNNSQDGIYVGNIPSPLTVAIDSIIANGNGNAGIEAEGTPTVTLGRSVITTNTVNGVYNGTFPVTFYSYGDNRIDPNGTGSSDNIGGRALVSDSLQ
jgi:hypothetical protein